MEGITYFLMVLMLGWSAFVLYSSRFKVCSTNAKKSPEPFQTNTSLWVVVIFCTVALLGYFFLSTTHPNFVLTNESEAVEVERYLTKNPKDFVALKWLANTYLDGNNLSRARELFLRAESIFPDDAEVLTGLAFVEVFEQQGQFSEEAARRVNRALQLDPNNTGALYLAGVFAMMLNNLELAGTMWKRAAELLEQRGNSDETLALLNQFRNAPTIKPSTTILSVNLKIAPELRRVRSDDFLLLFVSSETSSPPISVYKTSLANVQKKVTLSLPDPSLGEKMRVKLTARISKTGLAKLSPDDLETSSWLEIELGNNTHFLVLK